MKPNILPLCLLALTTSLFAQDWPQIHGPNRNGISEGGSLMTDWPDELEKVWKRSVGQGYAGPAIKGDSLIIFHRIGNENICERLNVADGSEIWSVKFPAAYAGGGVDSDLGPKAVPTIAGDKVILFGPSGKLICVNFEDGSTIWEKATHTDYSAREGYFGAGSSPIVVGDKVIVNVGGRAAAVVAFDLNDGSEVWKTFDDQASYSSPIASPDGSTVFAITRYHLLALSVESGELKFKYPFGARGPTVNGANPVLINNHLFLTSAYGVGARWIELSEDMSEVTEVWSNDLSFSSQYSTPIFIDGYLYGTAGREDHQNGSFRCVEAATGEVKWSEPVDVGHAMKVGDQILFTSCKGEMRVINPSPEKYDEAYKSELFIVPMRCIPAISNGKLFARSNAFGPKGQLACFAVGADE